MILIDVYKKAWRLKAITRNAAVVESVGCIVPLSVTWSLEVGVSCGSLEMSDRAFIDGPPSQGDAHVMLLSSGYIESVRYGLFVTYGICKIRPVFVYIRFLKIQSVFVTYGLCKVRPVFVYIFLRYRMCFTL